MFLLRIALGTMFLAHGIVMKVAQWTLPGTAERFASLGLAEGLAYVVCGVEILGGMLLVLGVQSRWVALGMVPILIGAAWAHWGNGWLFLNDGGGWEYPLYLAVLAIAQALIGDGRLALSPTREAGSAREGCVDRCRESDASVGVDVSSRDGTSCVPQSRAGAAAYAAPFCEYQTRYSLSGIGRA